MDNILAKIEAVLFAYGEPISTIKLAEILNLKKEELENALISLTDELNRQERGITLIKNNNKVQLATKPELTKLLENIVKQEFTEDLTPAALETLSIIAYSGPISRADIEYIRGVNSSFTIRNLLLRGLIDRTIDPKRANAYIYNPSFDLIKRLGLSGVGDLPDYEKYKQMVINLHQASLQQVSEKAEILIPENPDNKQQNPSENLPEPEFQQNQINSDSNIDNNQNEQ